MRKLGFLLIIFLGSISTSFFLRLFIFSNVFIIIHEYSNYISLAASYKVRVLCLSITLISSWELKVNFQVRYV